MLKYCMAIFFIFCCVFSVLNSNSAFGAGQSELERLASEFIARPQQFKTETEKELELAWLQANARSLLDKCIIAWKLDKKHQEDLWAGLKHFEANLERNAAVLAGSRRDVKMAQIHLYRHYMQDLQEINETLNRRTLQANLVIQNSTTVNERHSPRINDIQVSPDRKVMIYDNMAYEMETGRELWKKTLGYSGRFFAGDYFFDLQSHDDVGGNVTLQVIDPYTGIEKFATRNTSIRAIANWDQSGGSVDIYEDVWNENTREYDILIRTLDIKQLKLSAYRKSANGLNRKLYDVEERFGHQHYKTNCSMYDFAPQVDQQISEASLQISTCSPDRHYAVIVPDPAVPQGLNREVLIYNSQTNQTHPLILKSANKESRLIGDELYQKHEDIGNADRFYFSPKARQLAVIDRRGRCHYFYRNQNDMFIHQGTITKAPADSAMVAVVDDDISGKPLTAFLSNQDSTLKLIEFDLKNDRVTRTLPIILNYASRNTAFAVSSQNVALVAQTYGPDERDGQAFILNMQNGKINRFKLPASSVVTSAVFSGDGHILFLGTSNGALLYWRDGFSEFQTIANQLTNKQITHLAANQNGSKLWLTSSIVRPVEDEDENGWMAANSANTDTVLLYLNFEADSMPQHTLQKYSGKLPGLILQLAANADEAFALFQNSDLQAGSSPEEDKYTPLSCQNNTWNAGHIQWQACNYYRPGGTRTLPSLSPDASAYADLCTFPIASSEFSSDVSPVSRNPCFVDKGGLVPLKTRSLFHSARMNTSWEDMLEHDRSGAKIILSQDRKLSLMTSSWIEDLGGSIYLCSTETGDELSRNEDRSFLRSPIQNGAFLNGASRFLTITDDGLHLWEYGSGPELVPILHWVFLKNGTVVVKSQDQRFDSTDVENMDGIHWTVRHYPGRTMPLSNLMRTHYQPRLAEYVLNAKKLPSLPPIDQLNLNQHGVRRADIKPEPDAPNKVAVTVEVYLRGDDVHHPAQELKLFRDGQLVGKYTGDDNNGLFDLPDGKRQVTFHNIALPQNKSQVMFKAWAFNEDGVRSKYFDRPYDYKPVAEPEPKLHLVSVGVNSFDNPAWDLKLAANDAKGYAEILPAKLSNIKSDVQLLASGDGLTKPDKANLRAALQKLAEGGSSPDDIVVLAIASHGLTDDKDNQFYIVPADIPGQDKRITPELLAHSISTDELSDWLTKVDAAEIIMILDTCQSGAALGGDSFKPGPMGDKGLGQLAYDKAMRVLTATNENNAAMELDNLGHGLLSYALLVDGLGKGLAGQSEFTLKDWLAYGQERTAELYARIAKGESVGETRGKVKVDKTADNANPPLGQEPYLFDFGGGDKEIIRFQVK